MNSMKILQFTLVCFFAWVSATPNPQMAYVTNGVANTVTPINVATGVPLTPLPAGRNAGGIAITPKGDRMFITDRVSTINTISSIDLTTNTLSNFTFPGLMSANQLAITPDGSRLLVGGQPSTVFVLDITVYPPVYLFDVTGLTSAIGVAVHPNGSLGFVADHSALTVNYFYLTGNDHSAHSIPGNYYLPSELAVTADAKTLYVSCGGTVARQVVPIDLTVFPFAAKAPITDPNLFMPQKVAITATGNTVYVINSMNSNLVAINSGTNTVIADIPGIRGSGVGVAPGGQIAYACNQSTSTIVPINVATNTPLTPITGVASPFDVVFVPDQAPTASFTWTVSSRKVTFNAGTSSSPVGSVTTYAWLFGDSTKATTSSPVITHTYLQRKTYKVTLTVTNSQGTSTTVTFTGQMVSNNGGPSATVTQNVAV